MSTQDPVIAEGIKEAEQKRKSMDEKPPHISDYEDEEEEEKAPSGANPECSNEEIPDLPNSFPFTTLEEPIPKYYG